MSSIAASASPCTRRACLLLVALALLSARSPLRAETSLDGPLLALPIVPANSSEPAPPLNFAPVESDIAPPPASLPFEIASPTPAPAPAPPQKPGTLVIRVHGPESMRAKEVAKFGIEIVNHSPVNTGKLRIVAQIPKHLVPVELAPEKDCLQWPAPSLKPGERFVIHFVAAAKEALPIHLKVTAQVEITAEHVTRVTEPKLQLVFQGPKEVTFGEDFECILTVTNPGSGKLTRGGLELHPSSGLQVFDAPDAPSQSYDLEPGESLQIPLKLKPVAQGKQSLGAFAEADGDLRAQAEHHVIVHRPNFQVALTGPKTRLVGSPAEYTMTILNDGDAAAKSTLAFIELPEELDFVSAEQDGVYDPKQHMVYWKLDTMPPGRQVVVAATACPKAAGVLECRGSAKDCFGASAESYCCTDAKGQASVVLEMLPESDLAKIGDEIRYGFRLHNRGSLPASDVSLSVVVPDGLAVVEKASKGWTKQMDGSWQFEAIKKLSIDESREILLVLKAEAAGGKTLTGSVSSPDLAGKVSSTQALRVFDLPE